ncbi:ECF RNA polymerase sigma factor SigW [Nymphon striatum]|nr:ECF RNA polymerase sigma factor SigW [Nymphon striatum]
MLCSNSIYKVNTTESVDAVVKNNKQTVEEKTKRDTELLKRIADGDRDAFTELYKSYQPRLVKFCSRMLKYDVALASDMADEALIEVWRSAGSFSGLSQPSTWIHSIARFRMIGYLRKNKELLQDDDFEQLNIEDTDLLPEQEVIISERDQEIIDNLAKLSEKHREKIAMNIDTKNNDIPERALELLPWFVTNQLSSEDKAYFNEVLQANAALEALVKEEREIFNLVVEDKSLLGLSTLESPEARLENVFKQIDNLPVAEDSSDYLYKCRRKLCR